MAASNDTRQTAQAENSNVITQLQSLIEHTKAGSASSNDCAWVHEFVSSDAISKRRVDPRYIARVYYKQTRDAPTTNTKDFGTSHSALLELNDFLTSKHVRAVVLCHRDSSEVSPAIVALLWAKFKLKLSFIRHHFDYKEFRHEIGCSKIIRDHLEEEADGLHEDDWTFGGRWNSIQLPSETYASTLRLSVDTECLSVCCADSIEIVIALVRSKAVYQIPLSSWTPYSGKRSFPCAHDLYNATVVEHSINLKDSNDSFEFSFGIVNIYARLLVLRCYEDYNLRHDTQPIDLDACDRVAYRGYPYLVAMHHRKLELVKVKQNLSAYLGSLTPEHKPIAAQGGSGLADNPYRQNLRGLLTDVEMLLSLYENILRIYEWHVHINVSGYKAELASEQLEEARQSKTTAISLGRLSNLAFLYLPLNFVCAMLGMNLSVYGQGEVPIWVFFILIIFFSLLTYLPIFLSTIDKRMVPLYKIAYHLAWRSFSAGFWFMTFCLTHSHLQSSDIAYSGLAQEFLGYTGHKTKGWTENRRDGYFKEATWGSEAFWKEKVKNIFLAVEGSSPSNEPTELTV